MDSDSCCKKMTDLSTMLANLRTAFNSGKTRQYDWRRAQLLALLRLLDDNRDTICKALWQDLKKSTFESLVMEVDMCRSDLVSCIDNLKNWMEPTKVKAGTLHMFDKVYTKPEPHGVALVIAPWNYPVQLSLMPVVGAIAAGNCVVLKPSEIAESTALLLKELLPKYMDKECIACVTGGVPETTALLNERWDYIFYTGNAVVGKIVMKAAAEHLTPVTLELGGKSPVYIDDTVDLGYAANRIWWAKCANAGQTCIAPDYVMCKKDIQDALIDKMKATLKAFYPEGPDKSPDYPRIISKRHLQRIKLMMSGGGKVALGGDVKEADKYVAPTILRDVNFSDPIMKEEIFGPVLPVIPVKDENEAVEHIIDGEKPLALYVFSTNKAVVNRISSRCSSGSLSVNDCLMHITIPDLPFGGIGYSGMGSYHGKHSFDTFSHTRGCLERHPKMECLNNARYPPYNQEKFKTVQKFKGHGKQPKESGCILS